MSERDEHSPVRRTFERLATLVEQEMDENRSEFESWGLRFQREERSPVALVIHVDQDPQSTLCGIFCNDRVLNDIGIQRRNGEELMRIKPIKDRQEICVQYPNEQECEIKSCEDVAQEFLGYLRTQMEGLASL